MERRDRQVIVYFVLALAASLGLGLTIAYLEVRRAQEVVSLELRWLREVDRLRREVELLKEELDNKTRSMTERINNMASNEPDPLAEEDYYYDEEYEDDEEAEETGGKEAGGERPAGGGGKRNGGGRRSRREVGRGRYGPLASPYNLIIRQGHRQPLNRTGNPEVQARIIVAQDDQEAYEIEKESFDKPQRGGFNFASNVAVHFRGDTSRVRHPHRTQASRCYDANHRMCHIQGIFRDWSLTSWSGINDDTFTMRDGRLTLNKSPGIYYLYAQILYADNHDVNGYRIYVNGNPTFQCTITNLHEHRWIPERVPYKRNSCFTGGLVQLEVGDHILIREVDGVERYSVFEPYKSYFGLFQVASISEK